MSPAARPGQPARIAGQHRDLIGDVDRLLDRVGDEDDRLLLVGQQAQEVLLELAPVLLVDRANGSSMSRISASTASARQGRRAGACRRTARADTCARRRTGRPRRCERARPPRAPPWARGAARGRRRRCAGRSPRAARNPGTRRRARARAGDPLAVDQDLALGRLDQAGDDLQRGGLAAAGRMGRAAWSARRAGNRGRCPRAPGSRRTSCRPRQRRQARRSPALLLAARSLPQRASRVLRWSALGLLGPEITGLEPCSSVTATLAKTMIENTEANIAG